LISYANFTEPDSAAERGLSIAANIVLYRSFVKHFFFSVPELLRHGGFVGFIAIAFWLSQIR
jgi:hypothetical protein